MLEENLAKAKKATLYRRGWKATRRSFLDAIKDLPCQDCGGRFPPECMDFDHRDPELKSFGIGRDSAFSTKDPEVLRTLMLEVSKCDLICSNCHRIRTKAQNHAKALTAIETKYGS